METKVSEILENILGMLGLEGSFEVTEGPEEISVQIDTEDPGKLIGFRGETLDALQLIVNQILNKQVSSSGSKQASYSGSKKISSEKKDDEDQFKRVVIDVAGWRKNKEGDLERRARIWAEEVMEKKEPIELDPMPSWQRRIVHIIISEIEGVESESIGEGKDRHLVIRPISKETKKMNKTKEAKETKETPESPALPASLPTGKTGRPSPEKTPAPTEK